MLVAENLHFDVARRNDVFFDQHAGVAESRLGLALRRLERSLEIDVRIDATHATSAAARNRLDEHGVADLVGLLFEELCRLIVAVIARRDGRAGPDHQRLGCAFETHGAHRRARGAHECHPRALDGVGEIGILAEEAVTRM